MKTIHYIPTTTLLVDKYLYIYMKTLLSWSKNLSDTSRHHHRLKFVTSKSSRIFSRLNLGDRRSLRRVTSRQKRRNAWNVVRMFKMLSWSKIQTSNIFKTIGNVWKCHPIWRPILEQVLRTRGSSLPRAQVWSLPLVEGFHQGKRAPQFLWTSSKRSAKSRKSTREMASSRDFINQNVELTPKNGDMSPFC